MHDNRAADGCLLLRHLAVGRGKEDGPRRLRHGQQVKSDGRLGEQRKPSRRKEIDSGEGEIVNNARKMRVLTNRSRIHGAAVVGSIWPRRSCL